MDRFKFTPCPSQWISNRDSTVTRVTVIKKNNFYNGTPLLCRFLSFIHSY
jgi:hypothetical protein